MALQFPYNVPPALQHIWQQMEIIDINMEKLGINYADMTKYFTAAERDLIKHLQVVKSNAMYEGSDQNYMDAVLRQAEIALSAMRRLYKDYEINAAIPDTAAHKDAAEYLCSIGTPQLAQLFAGGLGIDPPCKAVPPAPTRTRKPHQK